MYALLVGVKRLTEYDYDQLVAHVDALRMHQLRLGSEYELGLELSALPPSGGLVGETVRNRYPWLQVRVLRLQDIYGWCCQICEWEARPTYGSDVCQGHHHVWLSCGGRGVLDNLVLVCPNHYRAIHASGASLDFRDLAFVFRRDIGSR